MIYYQEVISVLYSVISGVPVYSSSELNTDISHTACITGHREKNIPDYNNNPELRSITLAAVKLMLYRYIDMAIASGYTNFISGLAMGTDLWAADYIIKKRRINKNIRLFGAMPYLRHAERYPLSYVELLRNVEKSADLLITVNDNPDIMYGSPSVNKKNSKTLYRDRNYYMIDHSSAVIAFFNDNCNWSGTAQTLNYAVRKKRKTGIFSINDVFSILNTTGTDIRTIGREITFIENIFRTGSVE